MVVRSLFVWLSRVFSVWLLHWCLLTLSGGDVTHCHIVSLRRSPSSNTIKRVWGGISLLSVAVIYPNICPSSWHISVHARLRYLDKVRESSACARVCLWMERSPESQLPFSHYGAARHLHRERERKRATRSSPEFFRADIYNRAKAHCFQSAPMPQHPCDLHCALFRYDIGTFVLLCRRLDSQLTGSK